MSSESEKVVKIEVKTPKDEEMEVQEMFSSDSDNKLTICTNLPVKKRRTKRKKPQDEKPQGMAKAEDDVENNGVKNLSPGEIRKIIKKVVSNDHVLAMVRLKDEEADEEIEVVHETTDLMPKLTRLKAKELNKHLPPIVPLTLKPAGEESETALLMKDLAEEDEDDEEYKPSEEDFHSDDDTNTSVSDLDSLPATPVWNSMATPDSKDVEYTKDGLFKIPQICATPSPSKGANNEPFRPPALGTRSKVSLAKTTIEDIEETFVPPDITTDMYEFDCEMDNVWQEFLNQFRRPLTQGETHEEDEEADPEYIAIDQIPLDKEELREVKVSRKELSDLMTELFDSIDEDVSMPIMQINEDEAGGARTKPTPTKYQKNRSDASPEPSESPQMMLHSTPMVYGTREVSTLDMSSVLDNNSLYMETQGTMQIQETQCDATETMNFTANDSVSDIMNKVMELKYRQMGRVQPVEVFEPHHIGFTDFQRQILAQQMRMHIQLCTQHFIQTYSHPGLWKEAQKPQEMLQELWDVAKGTQNSTCNAINLQTAIELCDSWRREFDEINEENRTLIAELEEKMKNEESEKSTKQWSKEIFNNRILHLMMNSTVFLYPKLLPPIPFRIKKSSYNFYRHEGSVIMHFYDTVYRDLLDGAKKQRKFIEPSRLRTCEKIHSNICSWRTPTQIYKFIGREKQSKTMNPVKFYFENNRLLPVSHTIENFNPNQVLADLPMSCLPKNWEAHFVAEKKRKLKAQQDKELASKKEKRQKLIERAKTLKKSPGLVVAPEKQVTIFSIDSLAVSVKENLVQDRSGVRSKLEKILQNHTAQLEVKLKTFREYPILSKIHTFIWEFDIFLRLLHKTMQADKRMADVLDDDGDEAKKPKIGDEDKSEKRHKHRLHDSNRLLLLPERNEDVMQRDSVYSWNFFEKVECTFKAAREFDKFERFLTILNTFRPGKEEVADLYYRLEDLFLPEYPELAEVFLTILLPGHAAQVGKFFEHFILTNMHTFLARMNVYLAKQPHQLKKVYACLNELTREEGLTMDKIKSKFLPLLKGNQLLTDWFLQLFPTERPPASDSDEFEVISLRKPVTEEEQTHMQLTEEVHGERMKDPFENPPCSIKYMQGRIYYGNRVLLPAELSFLATSQEVDMRNEHTEPTRCVHEIRDAWDLKIQEGLKLVDAGAAIAATSSDGTREGQAAESPAKLCDYATLKMHTYRLNPHAITSEMVLACQESAEDAGKQSPKKATGGKKNPTSPKRNAGKGSTKVPETNSSVEMARRLKMFLTAEEKPPKQKRARQKKPPEEEKGEEVIPEKIEREEDVTWTREQDKTILEVINGELDSEEEVIERLVDLMGDRTREQITIRFHFLLNVLRKFQMDE